MALDWSDLPQEIWSLISKRLTSIKDYVHFGAVCRAWHSIATVNRCHLPHQLPFLMIPRPIKNSHSRKIYSICEKRVLASHLPVPHKKHCRGSTNGWLIAVDNENLSVHILNPFSATENSIQLPPLNTFPDPIKEILRYKPYIKKAVLSSNPTLTHNYTIMVIYGKDGKLAFSKPDDIAWTPIESRCRWPLYDDIIYYRRQFYAVDCYGAVVVCDLGPSPTATEIVSKPILDMTWRKRYLVELLGELLQVAKEIGSGNSDDDGDNENIDAYDDESYMTIGFRVFKLHQSTPMRWLEVKSIGDHMLFLGANTSVSLLASNFPGCSGNCIYFTDDIFQVHFTSTRSYDMGIYNLEDETIKPHYQSNSRHLRVPPPIWIAPSYSTVLLAGNMNPLRRYHRLMARLETMLQLKRK